MTSWIEKAEEKQKLKDNLIQGLSEHNSEVVSKNHDLINDFISKTVFLIDRVEKISVEFRKPSIEIGHTHLNGDTTYEFYGSAFINISRKAFLFKISQETHLCWRRIYFKIADEPDRCKVTLSEKCTSEKTKAKSKSIREKYKFRISDLHSELSQVVLDWLVFKLSTQELKKSFPKTHYKEKS